MKQSLSLMGLAILSLITVQANAAVLITEVAPWGSGNAPYATDWFELTNTGSAVVNISGWKMDDNSNSFASATSLIGITSIAAGESVIFTESAASASFLSTWFGSKIPAGLQIGNYTGAGVGLSATADAVNIYNASGVLQANVTFAASDAIAPYQTFDNATGLNNTAISTLSVVGINGAFVASNDVSEIGSPGRIAAAVPEADSYAMLLVGLGLMGFISRRRKG
ncbi:lamin tail domain-containing protein [Methylotenera sp.]|uniref:lamin tail domain-containing protein n=1 Tax=Methylotenera sp. TaxID=2051956 RepID=UPI002487E9A6|nr:lamin tail domain-containing protein [Methylotenera sp.]MDI1298050.1 lamin tail domain-containing protein [Methylotenera sp.]